MKECVVMAREVIPGIYMITNNLNGKVYIGQSKNILKRFKYYQWAATTDSNYAETKHTITKAIRKHGIENFTFSILDAGERYKNKETRLHAEIRYIGKYNANNPDFGYNEDRGGDPGHLAPRKQSFEERVKRAVPVFLYNIETQSSFLYLFGCKGIADEFGCDKAIVSHPFNRTNKFADKYFIIPAEYDKRYEYLAKREKKMNKTMNIPDCGKNAISRAKRRYAEYKTAVEYIDEIASEFGFPNDE